MHSGFARFMLRRAVFAAFLVLLVSSAALVLADLAPPDDGFGTDPAILLAEEGEKGTYRLLVDLYVAWLKQTRPVRLPGVAAVPAAGAALIRERAGYTALLCFSALVLATAIGVPLGVFDGEPAREARASPPVGGASIVALSVPPLITSLLLLLIAGADGMAALRGGSNHPVRRGRCPGGCSISRFAISACRRGPRAAARVTPRLGSARASDGRQRWRSVPLTIRLEHARAVRDDGQRRLR